MEPRKSNESQNKEQSRQVDDRDNPGEEKVIAAHDQAEKDILSDPELSIHSPNDDLDEGETARLGEDKNDLA